MKIIRDLYLASAAGNPRCHPEPERSAGEGSRRTGYDYSSVEILRGVYPERSRGDQDDNSCRYGGDLLHHRHRWIQILTCLAALLFLSACAEEQSSHIEASGIIETTDVTVSSKAAGSVLEMKVHEGDQVHVGDTLAIIDDTDLQLQREQFLAGVDVVGAQLQLLRNGARPEDIQQARAAVQQAQLNMRSAKDDLTRLQELYTVGSVAEKNVTDAKTRYELAERQLAGAQAGLTKLLRGFRSEEISAGSAREEQAQAQLAALDRKIADTRIIAPVDGIVTTKAIEKGELVGIGTPLLTISEPDPVKLKIYVPENELGRVSIGQSADLTIDSYTDRHFTGRVTYISPTAEFTPKNVQTKDDRVKLVFEVQITVPNPGGELKAGITADAQLAPEAGVAGK